MKVCNNCNTVNSDESRFCVSCGAEIVGSAGMANEFSNSQGFNSQNTMNQGQQFNQSTNQGQQFNAPDGSVYQGGSQSFPAESNPVVFKIIPVVVAVLGIIIAWNVHGVLGTVMTIASLVFPLMNKSKYATTPVIQIAVGIIATVIVGIMWII